MSEIDVTQCEYWANTELGYCLIGLWANDGTHICECEHNCYYKQLQQLKQENEELNRKLKIAYTAEAFVNAQKEHTQLDRKTNIYKLYLDEIEVIAKDKANACCSLRSICDFSCNKCLFETLEKILQLIKQAKEGEE